MWQLLTGIFGTYPVATYSLQDFVSALSFNGPHFALTVTAAGLTFAIGFIEYIYSFLLVHREGSSPYSVAMHTFYLAIDSMGIIVFALAAQRTSGFWMFTAASIAEVVWSLFEIYNLVKVVTVERTEIWGPGVTATDACWRIVGWLAVMIPSINLFRVFMNDPAMFKWYIFTNVLMAILPGLYWEKRGTQIGASWGLAIVICIGTINSFLPTNMWALISPYFTPENNPWFYCVGVVAIFFSLRTFWVLKNLPPKPKVLANGKRSVW